MTTSLRVLAAVVATVLLVALAVAISRTRTAPREAAVEPTAAASPNDPPQPQASPSPGDAPAAGLPVQPAEAEALGGDDLLAAGVAAARGDWRALGDPAWPIEERPVYVARAVLDDRRRVEADVAIAFRAEEVLDAVVLRLLPASEALGDNGLSVRVTRDGAPVDAAVDRAGARLTVPLDPPLRPGEATVIRVRVAYDITERSAIVDDGGPAGFGLLASNPDATFLGHWLPLLTVDTGPMVPWGDVGAFPTAIWSLITTHDGVLVTGGSDGECPQRRDGCTWSRGVALRDVSAVAYDAVDRVEARAGGLRVTSVAAAGSGLDIDGALDIADTSAGSFTDRFGPLAWRELDVAAAPLSEGAAGMEFPGLIVIDTAVYDQMDATLGPYVVAHEVGHQWFHALVGNGSLTAPVVDESLAQYLTYLYWADAFGETAAERFAATAFAGRYASARESGLEDEPPAQPLEEFAGSDAYGPLVYARAPLAWVAAEEEVGRDAVVAVLREVVDRWGLGFVDDEELLAFLREQAPDIAAIVERYWFDPAPVG